MSLSQRLKPSHLRLLVKIAEVGKLQVAADALGLSQPAASRILSMTETEAGGALFQRHAGGMEVTELGQTFIRHARVIQSGYEALEADIGDLNLGKSGRVRVGCVTGPAVDCLVPAVQALKAQSPGFSTIIEIGPSTQLLRGLEEGGFDFIIARVPMGHTAAEFLMHPARYETVSLMVHQSHPLAGAAQVDLAELSEDAWVMQEHGSPIRDAVEKAYQEQGLAVPRKVTDSSSLLVALAFVAGGNVVAPVTEQVANLLTSERLGARLVKLPIAEPIRVRPYFVIRNRYKQPTKATERLLQEVLHRL